MARRAKTASAADAGRKAAAVRCPPRAVCASTDVSSFEIRRAKCRPGDVASARKPQAPRVAAPGLFRPAVSRMTKESVPPTGDEAAPAPPGQVAQKPQTATDYTAQVGLLFTATFVWTNHWMQVWRCPMGGAAPAASCTGSQTTDARRIGWGHPHRFDGAFGGAGRAKCRCNRHRAQSVKLMRRGWQ